MPGVMRTSAAAQDLLEILERIAEADPEAAERLAARIDQVCLRLANMPYLGSACEEYGKDLRHFTVQRNFVLYYVPLPDGIELRRVVRGSRHLPNIFPRSKDSQDS